MAIEVIDEVENFRQNAGVDPARYLVNPGKVTGVNKHTPGQLRHARPYLVSGNVIFVFPVGVEGFTRSGSAQLGLHRYLGENAVRGNITHREEARIELRGTFPGNTSQINMVNCINVLRSEPPSPGLRLYAPGVFETEQYVLPESWRFTHDPEDRTHSIDYEIALVRTGEGITINDPLGVPPSPNPGVKTDPRGQPTRVFTVADGARTLRAIAAIVYKDPAGWQRLVTLNQGDLALLQRSIALQNSLKGLPTHQLPTYRFPIGTKFRY